MKRCGIWGIWLLAAATAIAATSQRPDAAMEWNERGLAAGAHGDHAGAEEAYLQAVEQWTALGPEYELHLAIGLVNLGQTYCYQGKRRDGARVFEQALAKFRHAAGVRNDWTLTTMNVLATVHLMLGEVERAEVLFREALPIEREVLPAGTNLARTLQGLATIDLNHHQLDTALALAEEALQIAIAAEGESMDAAMAYATAAEV